MKNVVFLLFCMHALAVEAQHNASSIYSSEWVVFDDEELDAFEIGMEMSATPTEICFKTIFEEGDTIAGKIPYYLTNAEPTQFVSNLVGKSSVGKYIVLDTSETRTDGIVVPGEFIVLEIMKLTATEMHLKGETSYIRKYRRKQP